MASVPRVSRALRSIEVAKITSSDRVTVPDVAAVEEPLEIRLHGRPFVVIMRTPGSDRELVAGFLFAERVISGPDDIGALRHCVDAAGTQAENVVDVTLAGGAADRVETLLAARRQATATSACGVCGRQTIDDLMAGVPPVRTARRIAARVIDALPSRLRATQDAFAETGGLHAAGLFDWDGGLIASAEDVGRHNAVDKVIGRQLLMDQPLGEQVLFVSGRAGYEIVQKAIVAGIALVASVSAPSSLAIALAGSAGLTLVGFARGRGFNVYTGADRIDVS